MPQETETIKTDSQDSEQLSSAVNTDVKPSTEASSATEKQAENQDDKTEAEAKTPEQITQDIVDAAYPASDKKDETKDKEVKIEDKTKVLDKPAKTNQQATSEAVDPTKQGDERYDKIPRFKELIDWKKTHEPLVQQAKEIQSWQQQYQISNEEFTETRAALVAIKTGNYNQALTMLGPIVDKLKELAGEVMPQDLQEAVDQGKIHVDYARQLAKSRSTVAQQEAQQRRTTEQSLAAGRRSAILSWADATRKLDPDFARKESAINREFMIRWAQKPNATPQELAALCQQSYETINEELKAFTPAPPERKLPSSNGSTTFKEAEPKTPFDRVMQIANKHYAR